MLYLYISVSGYQTFYPSLFSLMSHIAYSAHERQTVNPRDMVVGGTLARRYYDRRSGSLIPRYGGNA